MSIVRTQLMQQDSRDDIKSYYTGWTVTKNFFYKQERNWKHEAKMYVSWKKITAQQTKRVLVVRFLSRKSTRQRTHASLQE